VQGASTCAGLEERYHSGMAVLDEASLELLRSRSGLSIDLEGRLCHQGEPITHARTLEVLWRSLKVTPDGRYLVEVGRERGYLHVEDAPYGVRGMTLEAGWPILHLTDGAAEALDPSSLWLDREGILHCLVKPERRPARFQRSAQVDLGLLLEEAPEGGGDFLLRLGDRTYAVRRE
jgi:uncharacterized protein